MFTVIIPTVQKNKNMLDSVVKECAENELVKEIIVIDNSCKGYSYDSNKVRIILPKNNLYVNPAWNLGVKETKTEYFALLNDDILAPRNLFVQVLDFLKSNPNAGVIGMDFNSIINSDYTPDCPIPQNTTVKFEKLYDRVCPHQWGCAIFGQKSNYKVIPEEMKIWCGDDYLLFANNKSGNDCYKILNANTYHFDGLTSSSGTLFDIKRADLLYFIQINPEFAKCKYKLLREYDINVIPWYKKLFSVSNEYSSENEYKIIRLLGIKFKYKQSSNSAMLE